MDANLRRQTLSDTLRRSAARVPGRLGIACGATRWTYAELHGVCERLAAGLAARGIRRGDKVAVLARNSHGFVALRYALMRLGAVMVPINFMLQADDVAFILNHSAEWRGSNGGARRDLQDLAAAIGHHAKEGLHRSVVRVALPPKGRARQRWLTRDEVARLLWTCWRNREVQDGRPTDKRPLRHLARLLLIGIYTGSRPGAILNASWRQGPGLSWVDTVNGVFHRHADGEAATTKRQPTVKLSPRLLAHLRRWKRLDVGKGYVVSYHGTKVASVKTALHTACKLAGVDAVTAYTLRHTAASWLVARGLPTRKVADFIGTGEQMILSHYGHLAPDYQDEAARAIGRKA